MRERFIMRARGGVGAEKPVQPGAGNGKVFSGRVKVVFKVAAFPPAIRPRERDESRYPDIVMDQRMAKLIHDHHLPEIACPERKNRSPSDPKHERTRQHQRAKEEPDIQTRVNGIERHAARLEVKKFAMMVKVKAKCKAVHDPMQHPLEENPRAPTGKENQDKPIGVHASKDNIAAA